MVVKPHPVAMIQAPSGLLFPNKFPHNVRLLTAHPTPNLCLFVHFFLPTIEQELTNTCTWQSKPCMLACMHLTITLSGSSKIWNRSVTLACICGSKGQPNPCTKLACRLIPPPPNEDLASWVNGCAHTHTNQSIIVVTRL